MTVTLMGLANNIDKFNLLQFTRNGNTNCGVLVYWISFSSNIHQFEDITTRYSYKE